MSQSRIEINANPSGRKRQLVVTSYMENFLVFNISALVVDRKALEEALATWKQTHYAQLPVWEYLAKLMPDWEIIVRNFDGGAIFWSNVNARQD